MSGPAAWRTCHAEGEVRPARPQIGPAHRRCDCPQYHAQGPRAVPRGITRDDYVVTGALSRRPDWWQRSARSVGPNTPKE